MDATAQTPAWAMVHLTHAVLQGVADRAGADILHIKGPTDAPLRERRHDSSDADVLVRPEHIARFVAALRAEGWSELTDFENGSPFGHAANFVHSTWAAVDVHRAIPGFRLERSAAFDRLWNARTTMQIGHRACAVPASPAQVVIQVTHAARSHGAIEPETWNHAEEPLRAAARALAVELEAEVAFAAGLGELSEFRTTRDYALWKHWSSAEDNRFVELVARLRSADGMRERARLISQALRVNQGRMRLDLGRAPSRSEIAAERRARFGRAYASGVAVVVRLFRSQRRG